MSKRTRDSRSTDQWLQVQIDALKRRVQQQTVISGGFPGANAADPTAQVILSAVNGVATTWMRSDAAPPLSQAISPTMTGTWAFTPTANAVPITVNAPAALTSANMQTWSPLVGLDTVVTKGGNVGVGDEAPTANVSIRARASGMSGLSPIAWFRAEDYNGTTWPDYSGNGRNLTAHTFDDGNVVDSGVQTAKPRLNAPGSVSSTPNLYSIDGNYLFSGGVTYEGLFRFDGTAMPSVGSSTGGFTVFLILRDFGNGTGSESFRVLGNNSVSQTNVSIHMPSSNSALAYTNEGASQKNYCTTQGHADGNGTSGGGDLERWGLRCAATSGALQAMLDGVLLTASGDTRTTAATFERVGHINSFGGWRDTSICELIVFGSALTDQQMADVDTYLLARVNGQSTVDLLHVKAVSGSVDSVISAGLNWGIGTLAPASKLHLIGDFTIEGDISAPAAAGAKIGLNASQKFGFWGATPVVRDAGWTPSNVTTDRTFNADLLTLNELSDVVGTLVQKLTACGILGT